MPVDVFERRERERIADKIVFKLLDSKRPVEHSNLRTHVVLLVRFMERPSKTMELVSRLTLLSLFCCSILMLVRSQIRNAYGALPRTWIVTSMLFWMLTGWYLYIVL